MIEERKPLEFIIFIYFVTYILSFGVFLKNDLNFFTIADGMAIQHFFGLLAFFVVGVEIYKRMKAKQPIFKKLFKYNIQ